MDVIPVQRRRHGSYSNPDESKRQSTVIFKVPNGTGQLMHVCKQTFISIFAVTKNEIDTLVKRKKMGESIYNEKRGKYNKPCKFSESDRLDVKTHINSIPRCESHYTRARSSKEYLSPDLSVNRLFKAFKEKYPDTNVTYKFYLKVFSEDFPNVSFRKPRTDTCRVCDRLQCEIKCTKSPISKTIVFQLEKHQRKAEKAQALMKHDIAFSQQPHSDISVLCMDLQQVMFVPTLSHSDMFYKRQLSCYNFGVHLGDTNKAYMCMWNECEAGRGANEIASCLFYVLNNVVGLKKHVVLYSDNCCAQNKNRIILFMLMFLVYTGTYDIIEQKFLVTGHSFLPCDRDFAIIEKRKRVCSAYVPEDLHKVVKSACHTNKFNVVDMTEQPFLDFQTAADSLINTKELNISKLAAIRVTSANLGYVETKESLSEIMPWKKVRVLKKGKTMEGFGNVSFSTLERGSMLSAEKKRDLKDMIPYLPEEHKPFYMEICK